MAGVRVKWGFNSDIEVCRAYRSTCVEPLLEKVRPKIVTLEGLAKQSKYRSCMYALVHCFLEKGVDVRFKTI
jgi:hypothetical protein